MNVGREGPAGPKSPRRVLFLAYMFPPVGGGGVQRSLKFVKYLPISGWTPVVITVRDIAYYVYDKELLEEIPSGVEIVRTESIDPLRLAGLFMTSHSSSKTAKPRNSMIVEGSRLVSFYRALRRLFFFPDAQLGWIPFAVLAGRNQLRRYKVDAIYSPGAPYSSTVIAYFLSRLHGVPYVIDFRDGWTDDIYHQPPSRAHRWAHQRLERVVVTNASAVCVYGEWLAKRLAERYPAIAKKIITIPNGFDPADLNGVSAAEKTPGKVRIVYSGSLFAHHREAFTTVLQALTALAPPLRAKIELIVVGQTYAEITEDIAKAKLDSEVQLCGYVSHATALAYLLSTDASLLIVKRGDLGSVTGKVFELLMVGKPIIALAEKDGACAQVLHSAESDQYLYGPDDSAGVCGALESLASGRMMQPDANKAAQFSRTRQAALLAGVLDRISGERPRQVKRGVRSDPQTVLATDDQVRTEVRA
jgi:glycosyltransferase involved in cell wall biosynthesis